MRLDHLLLGRKDKRVLTAYPILSRYGNEKFLSYSFLIKQEVLPKKGGIYFRKRVDLEAKRNGGIAQLVEHLPCKQGVIGSNPITSTKTGS